MASSPTSTTPEPASITQDPSEHNPSTNRRSSQASSPASDSQVVLVSHPSLSPTSSPKPKLSRHFSTPRKRPTDDEPRRCWICFSDETEDTPTSTAWRSPCPCALTAHESCLLDWVADLEAPNRKGKRGAKIECPQCKAEISIARPNSWAVEVARAMERVTGKLVFPILTGAVVGSVFLGLSFHGIFTINLVFGPEDANRLWNLTPWTTISSYRGPPLDIGCSVPFIPIILVLSRTTIADSILPLIPLFFILRRRAEFSRPYLWPPSAGMTLAALPFIRAGYNALHRRFVLPKAKAWLKEIQPRAGDDTADNMEQVDGVLEAQDDDDGEAIVDIGVGVEVVIGEGMDDEPGQDQEAPEQPIQPPSPQGDQPAEAPTQGPAAGLVQDQPQDREAPADPRADPQGQPDPVPPLIDADAFPALANRNQNIILSTSHLGDLVVGALLFPVVSAAMGQLIAITFPYSWVTPPSTSCYQRPSWPRGILQHRWGRSIVGGCAFIVLKDTVLAYSRWRLARDHRRRRILDYAEKKGKDTAS